MWAPLLLILLRLLQGLSVGGEMMTAALLAYELTRPPRRGALVNLIWVGSGVGTLLGACVAHGVQHYLGDELLLAYGWRIPFFIGAGLGLIGIYLRRQTAPLLAQFNSQSIRLPLARLFTQHKTAIWQIALLFGPNLLAFYLCFVYMPSYIQHLTQVTPESVFALSIVSLLILQIFPVLFGYYYELSHERRMLSTGLVLIMLSALPIYYLILHGGIAGLWLGQCSLALLISFYASSAILHAFGTAPQELRLSVIAFGYNLSGSLFGSALPVAAVYLMVQFHQPLFLGVVMALTALVTMTSLISMSAIVKPQLS
jgi:MHS family proline/betaine transporter-like MFS transporter